jgi:hypothetical protein
MLELYYHTGNIWAVSPFIDTDNVFPALLEQSAIKEEARALPVLVFAGAESEDIVDSGTADSEEGTGKVTEAGGATGAAESRTTSYRTFVAFVNLPMTKVTGLCLPCGQTASCDAFRIRLFA